jgi:hypothetical protein
MAQHPKRVEHMVRRKAVLTQKELGEEFGMSGSHAGNLARKHVKESKQKECD